MALRQRAIKELMRRLGDISIANGFNTDVTTVTRNKKTDEEIPNSRYPIIQVMTEEERAQDMPNGFSNFEQDITLLCFVLGSTEDASDELIDGLREDVLNVCYTGQTLQEGGVPSGDHLVHRLSYLGSFQGEHEDGGRTGQIAIRLQMQWERVNYQQV